MEEDLKYSSEEKELNNSIDTIIHSPSKKKMVIAGPGTGKTSLFKRLLKSTPGSTDQRIVMGYCQYACMRTEDFMPHAELRQ